VWFVEAGEDATKALEAPEESLNFAQKLASVNSVAGLTRQECQGYGRSSMCGNHMNLGGPPPRNFPMAWEPFS
jgi:hypothetical protein